MRDYETAETILWIVGLIMLAAGCGLMWGWPAALIALGAVFLYLAAGEELCPMTSAQCEESK